MSSFQKKGNIFYIPFHTNRNISSPDDKSNDRKVYVGQFPISSILNIPTDENVRDYLLEAEGKTRKRPTQVHRAILDTLENTPHHFSVLNGGVTIVARGLVVDEKNRQLILTNPSIINGAQTQGVVKDFFKDNPNLIAGDFEAFIKFEIIVTSDEDLIASVSIARNFQNDVMTISIVGRLGQLDELEAAMQRKSPSSKLKKSETKLSDNYIQSERLLQVLTALTPKELWIQKGEVNKVYAYNMKSKCLKQFQEVYKKAKDQNDKDHKKNLALYNFYLDIASNAWALYWKWKKHSGFVGTRIKSIERDSKGQIQNIPDGIVFPILAALSEFIIFKNGEWQYMPPTFFNDNQLITAAKSTYMDIANSNPMLMGKSKACYSSLNQITQIYKSIHNA
ncbi:AIPR family protein [Aureispira anguillae]|uniref:AIPR family protein n=1 Tax=Aureispira anguillae TaxID=2864201 RepID=A0A916DR27_9BACT|nr:AIPR family protein [Aureispira anguillae]BDS10092.1 AIPR family protein [Aureispira anguillae]